MTLLFFLLLRRVISLLCLGSPHLSNNRLWPTSILIMASLLLLGPHQGKRHGLDRISSLPEDIILYMLSFLDIKAAGRTSMLSQRWRNVWTKLVDLTFDVSKTWFYYDTCEMERNRYVEWVNQVIGRHGAPLINTFKVHFLLDKLPTTCLDKWVEFAIQKGVRNLELNLSYRRPLYIPDSSFFLPFSGFALLKTQLESLTLVGVNICGSWLQFILSNCHNLQRVSVKGNENISSLKIVGSSLKLKQLEISSCCNLEKLEIFANNLSSLLFWGGKIDVEYRNVPSLVDACFGGPYGSHLIRSSHCLSGFSSQLEKLSLSLNEMVSLPIGHLTFTNIKTLILGVIFKDGDSLLFLISYLEACPFMHKLSVKLKWSKIRSLGPASQVQREAWKEAICTHKHLKVVELIGFIGGISDVELALYLISKYALKLEKIIFDPRNPALIGLFEPKEEELREPRRRALQLLKQVPSTVDVVII